MKARELTNLGIPRGETMRTALASIAEAAKAGYGKQDLRAAMRDLVATPSAFTAHEHFGALAAALIADAADEQHFVARSAPAPYAKWGKNLDEGSVEQMRNACALPVAVSGALMPDAHVGYGLPIGGVLATRNAVIPYAVGVDIACRMKLTVLDLPVGAITGQSDRLAKALENETRFGVGASFRERREHDVLDADWRVSPITQQHKDKAWSQLGTSGSGNHFVEYGSLEVHGAGLQLAEGKYLALLSHSGSRGTGAAVADHYSKLAMKLHRDLPKELMHLAWLDLDSEEGQEYWAAMELMGKYAAANHACIHRHIAKNLGAKVLLDIENHHNFAWKETHNGERVIVHRKGATPAGEGVLGIIPGSMATPGYIVRGKGNPLSLNSASHGAGRRMSRKQAIKSFTWSQAKKLLAERGVTLLSAGLDEVPMAYKDIDEVMAAQTDLVEVLARFDPKIVKMAPAGERAED
ncbi:MAG: RtcB family protein [Candidatus Hydrogenedentes bacterium]|nr:RtcB family protein [Candidatus Hydrogenedentota bacterium]